MGNGHVSFLRRWPTPSEVPGTDLLSLARVKDAILNRDVDAAENLFWSCLYDPEVRDTWIQCLGSSIMESLLGFIRRVQFDTSVPTSIVNLEFGYVTINPIFFLRFITNAISLIELILHERDHRVLRVLHGHRLFHGFSDDEFNLCEDVYIQARLRFMIGSSMVDLVQLAGQVDAEIEQRERIRSIPVHGRTEEERSRIHRPVRTTMDPTSRYTLMTSSWRTFKGPGTDKLFHILDDMESGNINQSYPVWVTTWRSTFPFPSSSVHRMCGHGPLPLHSEPPVRPDGEDSIRHKKVISVDLPDEVDPTFVAALQDTLAESDPLASDDTFRQVRHDAICLDKLVERLVAPTYARAVDDGIEYMSFNPRIDRSSILPLSLGYYPTMYVHSGTIDDTESAWALYIDVSGSMYRHYGIVAALARLLGPYCSVIKQFSEQIVRVGTEEPRIWTTEGTDYNIVCRDALDNRYRRIVVVTDNTEQLSIDMLQKMRESGIEVHLVSVNYEMHDRDKNGFNALARVRTDLPPRP